MRGVLWSFAGRMPMLFVPTSDPPETTEDVHMIASRRCLVLLSLGESPLAASILGAQPTSVRPLSPSAPRQQQEGPTVSPAPTRGVGDPRELTAFLDGIMAANLRDKHVAGATVAVVKDGALFFAKGYGYSDVARRAPVDAERTLFRSARPANSSPGRR